MAGNRIHETRVAELKQAARDFANKLDELGFHNDQVKMTIAGFTTNEERAELASLFSILMRATKNYGGKAMPPKPPKAQA